MFSMAGEMAQGYELVALIEDSNSVPTMPIV